VRSIQKLIGLAASAALVLAVSAGLSAVPAFAGNSSHGNSGDHGHSGDNGNGNGNGNGNSGIGNADASSLTASVGSPENSNNGKSNIASLAGAGNAAHASVQGLLHASPNSAVGRVKTYADLNFKLTSGDLQKAVTDAQTAFDTAYPNFSTLTGTDLQTALASPEYKALQDAQSTLTTAQQDEQAALGKITKNADNPAVKSYIDGLLSKYYAYLGTQ